MQAQVHPYVILLAISATISHVASFIAWRRSAPGAFVLGLLMSAMSVWAGGYALVWLNASAIANRLGWAVMYLGVVSVPVLYLIFTLKITHNEKWLTPKSILAFSVIPAISLLLQWTNDYHHWIYRSIDLIQKNNLLVVQFTRGPWYYVNTAYSYLVIMFTFLLMVVITYRSGPLSRIQHSLVLLASSIPWLASLYSELGFVYTQGLDLAPVSFGVASLLFLYSVIRNRLLDLLPMARHRLIEDMSDGVLVVDAQGRIVDINPAMQEILKDKPVTFLGKNIADVMTSWTEMNSFLQNNDQTRTELRLQNEPSRYMDLRMTPLFDEHNQINGRIIVFRDITYRKQVEKELVQANDRLHTKLIEIGVLQSQLREQAIRDPLTDLFNRRYLDETLERELSRAERETYPLCIVMMDIDHFKDVNDVYGHQAGDVVLKSLADSILAQCRQGDFACRYGGEEFVLVMPNICLDSTSRRAEEIHQEIEAMNIPYGRFNLSITISMGVACYPHHGRTKEELLGAADKALYMAKHAGRNRVSVYQTAGTDLT
jgi:diguanylate cyclase (GGDEF)-like protein/PAS domain S-box-containing protein